LLERSTALDPNSARSWYELARRYDIEFINAGRGRGFLEQALEANRHALKLAPAFSPARLQEVMLEVQGGQLISAYHSAVAMVQQHPEDANAHFALAYTLRHGGMFEEAAVECDRALSLDPSNAVFRPCGLINVLLGRYDRALVYVDLDPLSSNARFRRMELAILRNDMTAALLEVRSIRVDAGGYPDARLMEAALSGAPAEIIRNWSRENEALNDRITLPELHFVDARYQSWAGQPEAALRLLRRAIANNYCSYPVMDSDPFLANIRKLPEYKELRELGIACRENFRSQMKK
jgi:tetratricopeptide (TPR) repeat protein